MQPGSKVIADAATPKSAATMKCGTCAHMGRIYHDGGLSPDHTCAKSDERRAATMKPTGDRAEDFMRNWRTFFDATPEQRACAHHEPREPLTAEEARVLAVFKDSQYGGAYATFRFLTPENMACERMDRLYVLKSRSTGPEVSWRLTPFGRFALREHADLSDGGHEPSTTDPSQVPGISSNSSTPIIEEALKDG